MGKVVEFNGVTRLDIPPERVLAGAQAMTLTTVVIMGYDEHGHEYFAASCADGGLVLWLMEKLKQRLLDVEVQ
jgi:hypothetical protein